MPNKKTEGKGSHAWLYKPYSKKDAAFKRAVGFLQGRRGTANHSSPKWCTQGMKCFPQWCVRGGNGWGQYADGGMAAAVNEAAASKKTGHGFETKGATGQCIWGWVRSPLHCSTKACASGFQRPTKGLTHATPDRIF